MNTDTILLLDEYDKNIEVLNISNKNIIGILDLDKFKNLKILYCQKNKITELINLPFNLEYLNFSNNEISKLDFMLNNLKDMEYNKNPLTHLTFGDKFNKPITNLPNSITHLILGDNFDQDINNLQNNITHLIFGNNFNKQFNFTQFNNLQYVSFGKNFNKSNINGNMTNIIVQYYDEINYLNYINIIDTDNIDIVRINKIICENKNNFKYEFNKEDSLEYYNNATFRKLLKKKINIKEQLSLDLSGCHNIIDVSVLSNVNTLNLKDCWYIEDLSKLNNVYKIIIGNTYADYDSWFDKSYCIENLKYIKNEIKNKNLVSNNIYLKIFQNEDLFDLINKYTNLRQICYTCSSLLYLKNRIYYNLNFCYSLCFYYNYMNFRNYLINNLIKPNKQLSLNLKECCNITNTSVLNNVHSLNLSCCENIIIDTIVLENIHTLNLSSCNIKDVSSLANVHTLNLSNCRNITDISSLGNVHTLHLSHCEITDVSSLGNVNTLNLSSCRNITDVSALGNVHILNLSYCHNITDVRALVNSHTLNLSNCRNITDVVSLGNVHTLNLSSCDNIKDVSSLGNIHTLNLSYCNNITDVSALGNVHTLDLSHCENIKNVSALGNVHTLDLSYCNNITDVSALGNVNTLYLNNCDNISNVSSLGNVHVLDLSDCDNITDVSELGNVHTLYLNNCYNIIDVRALKNVKKLSLINCEKILVLHEEDITSVKKIKKNSDKYLIGIGNAKSLMNIGLLITDKQFCNYSPSSLNISKISKNIHEVGFHSGYDTKHCSTTCHTCDYFSDYICCLTLDNNDSIVNLPKSLTYLTLGKNFNGNINYLPDSIKHLVLYSFIGHDSESKPICCRKPITKLPNELVSLVIICMDSSVSLVIKFLNFENLYLLNNKINNIKYNSW